MIGKGIVNLKLFQESEVVAPEVAYVFDAVFEHGDAFWPHAEGKTGVGRRVITAVFEDNGVNHATPQDFQPARVFAHLAAIAVAQDTFHVHFRARFGEGEVVGAETHFAVGSKHAAGEVGEGAFEVGKGDVAANCQPFYLVELYFAAGGDLFVAVAHARQDDTDGFGAVLVHGVNLAGAGVGAEDHAGGEGVEGIPHVAGGVVLGDVEQLEVVFVGFYVAAAVDLEAHIAPDAVDLTQGLGGGVQAAAPLGTAGQGDIESSAGDGGLEFGRFQHL